MKKLFNSKTKKITSALIAATISMSLLTAAPASAEFGQYDNPTENIEAVTDNIFEIQRKACEAHELLYSSFGWEETYIYPNDFGGDFIDYDTLHIQVTNEEAIDYYKNLLSEYTDTVVYDIVNCSYNDIKELTRDYAKELEREYEVVSYSVDVKKNNGKISVLKSDYSDVMSFMNKVSMLDDCDKNEIQISIEAVDSYQEETSIIAGSPLTNAAGGGLTLGGSGYYNGSTAFVTCGHSIDVGASVKFGSSSIGTATISQNKNSGNKKGDYSIITAAAGYSATSSVLTGGGGATSFTGYMLNPAIGTYVYKYGKVSGQAYCEITDVDVTYSNTDGITQAKIITGSSTNGDSGGPYRCGRDFCGIHKGSKLIGSDRYVYFTPYTYIYNRGFTIEC